MKTLFISFLLFTAGAVWAQDDSVPGRSQATNDPSIVGQLSSGAQPLFQPELMPITQSSSAIAEAITPDIQSLADNLGGNPTLIFNYVHDQIRYVHYFGSKKGAELTLLERSGNDFDQCALLAALLQASGYQTEYQFGWMEVPYDNLTNQLDLHHWLSLNLNNTNWTYTLQYLANLCGNRGFYTIYNLGSSVTNDILIQHMVVTLSVGGTNYYLDPSLKVSEPIAGANLASAVGVSSNTLWTAAGGTDTGSYTSGLNEASLRTSLQSGNSNLLGYISNNVPNATVTQIIGGQQIMSSSGLPLSTSLNYPFFTNTSQGIITVNWTNQPTNFMGSFTMTFAGTNQTWLTPQFEGQRLSLIFETNGTAQLWQEDSLLLQTTNTGTSNTLNVVMRATHPYGSWNTSENIPVDTGVDDYSFTNTYQRTNATYAIMYAFEANQAWLKERQQMLNTYIQEGLSSTSREVTTETLNVMGLGWMVQTELTEEVMSQEWGLLPENFHRFGRMAQEAGRGYYVDVYLQLDGTYPATGYSAQDITNEYQVFDVSSYFWSAMEHGIIEQLQNSNLVAASTVKMIEVANTNSQDVYLANSGNWTTVRSSLVNYGATTNTLGSLVSSGFTLLLPQNGSNLVTGTSGWAGYGYVQLGILANGARSMGMIINGAYNGGYVNDPTATINPPFVNESAQSQPTYFDPQPATLPVPAQLGADPINMVDGTFQITSTDLAVGQTEPRGLNLTRYYSSERINANPAGMAPGWLHSYYCNATAISDPEGGLGTETVEQMSPMIVATYTALNLYNNIIPDPKNWTTTALIAKWGIDQLINNAVTINLGNATIQFTKQPSGSYTPPPNCTMSLISTNGAYWLQERHGRTFKFNTNSVLTNIVDQYGQSMKLSYNSNNLVTNVTDWTNRSLTFTYTGGVLTSVSDSSGRSVSYGYTNGELTSYIDPQANTTTYAYDTNNELIATFDGLGNLVESNYYDGSGHVTSQLTEGNTNKTWQVLAAGYYTIVLDPAGDEQIYTYDNQSRPIAFQDGMANVTRTVYDGQNHVIQTVSPLNETNQFFYDGSNNLIETIDPLGYSNVFTFDANNNLITSIDGRGNTSHFGYNAEFSPTGVTNGNGDWFVFAYNSNGTLASRQDSGGTTTYAYDSYGTLNNITYPSSLGSESFVNSSLGDPTSHTDVRGFTTTFAYNNRRQLTNSVSPTNLTTKATFDANANLSTTSDARGFVTSNSWSTTRKLLSTTLPATAQGTPVVTSTYDNRDWLAATENPLGNIAYYTNDAAHRLIAATDPLQRTTHLGYDNDSHEITSTDAAGDLITQNRDSRGSLVKMIDAATNSVGKTYDGAGNLIYLTNRNGKLWTFKYDGANRLTNTTSPLSHTSSQIYNNRGLLQSSTDPLSQTSTFAYDARARMTSKTDNIGVNDYQYDGNNNLTMLTNVTGPALSWVYDAYNRPVSFTNAAGYVIQYRYDANGNITNLIYPGNLAVNYYYDSNNRLTNVTDWSGRQTAIAYDLAGHITSVTRPNNTIRLTSYDNAGELTNIVEETTTKFPICFYTLHYNLAARTDWEFKGPLPHSNSIPTRTMTYDSDNRLATFNSTAVTVDSDGNLTYGPGTNNTFQTYTYDARNELTSAGGISYGYDPAGNRTFLTNGAAVTAFVINPKGSQLLMRIRPNSTNYYIYGVGLLYEIDVTASGTTTAFYHFDCRGSTVALTDSNGNPTDGIEYSPYGSTTYRFGTNDTPFLYNGQFSVQTDPNGLMFFHARYYNPYISRFLNPDPSGFAGGLNFYAFANGNPISEVDPFGLGGMWYNSLASWANSTTSTAQSFYANNLPWAAAGALNTAISVVGNVLNTPQAIANVGTGTGTFSANPTLANSAGVFSDISIVAGTLSAGFAPLPSANVPIGYGNVVYRYVGENEAATAEATGNIPNTYADGTPKTVYVTSDSPLSSATDAESTYQIGAQNPNGATPTPQYIIAGDGSSVDLSGPTPVVGGSGTEMTTPQQIPVISVNPIGYNLVNGTTAAGTSWLGGAVNGSSTGK
jgi:RHS repeat-associated protein